MRAFEAPKTDPKEDALISDIADIAQVFASSLDLKRFPKSHIYRALTQAGIAADDPRRNKLISKIVIELLRRESSESTTRPSVPFSEREDIIADARSAEARHPKEDDEA